MLACARIGATHTVIFGGFSARPARSHQRLRRQGCASRPTAAIGAARSSRSRRTSTGRSTSTPAIKNVRRRAAHRPSNRRDDDDGRDHWWHELMQAASRRVPAPSRVDAEHPLFILYTSGTTGKPKGIVHTTGGYLLGALPDDASTCSISEDDIYWCTADIGWVTGHSYVVYGPLAERRDHASCTRARPTTPTRIASGHHRAATASRFSTRRRRPSAPSCAGATSGPSGTTCRRCACWARVGEPINPEAWMWYHERHRQRALPDRRHLVADRDRRHHDLAAAGRHRHQARQLHAPVLRRVPRGRQADGNAVRAPNEGGYLVIKKPVAVDAARRSGATPSATQAVLVRRSRGVYFTGDGARHDEDGYFWVMGRVDDVLNVAGHRLGTTEIESALVSHPARGRGRRGGAARTS